MTQAWESVRLEQVLIERRETPKAQDLISGTVKVVSKISFSDGLIQIRQSSDTKTGMILAYPGDILVSGINASKGAIAIYDPNASSPIAATIHYGAYTPIESRVDRSFLWWLLRSKTFGDLLQQYVPGGIKTELKAKRFLPIPIPLPPLEEQRRIVARVESLAAQIAEARGLRESVVAQAEQMCRSYLVPELNDEFVMTPMKELVSQRPPDVNVQATEQYHFAGVYCFGRGMFKSVTKYGSEFAYPKLSRVKAGDFTYPKLMAWEGALSIVPPECDGLVVSTEFPVFTINTTRILPEVLDVYFKTPSVWEAVAGTSTGTNARRRRLNPSDFLEHLFPLPSMKTQLKIQQAQMVAQQIQQLQEATRLELNALLPSVLSKAFAGEL